MTHEEVRSLIASYVLGAVPEDEAREVRSHIMSCDECMQEAEGYSGTVSSLALAVEEEKLPRGFADAVLAKVAEERPGVRPEPAPARRGWGFRLVAGVAALGVVASIVLGAAFFAQREELERFESAVPQLIHVEGLRLAGSGGAVARLVPTAEGAAFFATGLDEAPDRHTYQLWIMECADPSDMSTCEPTSVGTFDVSGGIAILETTTSLKDYDRAAVTVEPDGGSPAPTTLPVIDSAA
ncbi:MAG: anti-sigma factor [Actinomycetota bacterium]|nr:anti-sigma factor [Actinomycetota bacterium]